MSSRPAVPSGRVVSCCYFSLLLHASLTIVVHRSSSTVPLLSATYANSPVNTSPPFAPSAAQLALQENTRATAEELMSAAARLQKVSFRTFTILPSTARFTNACRLQESEMSSRDRRKLGAFVEKWTRVAD